MHHSFTHGHKVLYDIQHSCRKHLPSLVIWINLYHKCHFYHPVPRFLGLIPWHCLGLYFFLLSWPEGVSPCDQTDWWPPCSDRPHRAWWTALWLLELWEHCQRVSFCFPCSSLSYKERSLNPLSYFISLWWRADLASWFQLRPPCLDGLTVAVSGHLAWANLCCRLSLAGLPPLPVGHGLHTSQRRAVCIREAQYMLVLLMILCCIGVSVHLIFSVL